MSNSGFTLLELLIVIIILTGALAIIFPSISGVDEYVFNSEVRRVAGLIRHLDEAATQKKLYYKVWFSPDDESIYVETSPDGSEFELARDSGLRGFTLKSGADIEDITLRSFGKVDEGKVAIIFNPTFGAEAFNLHLRGADKVITLNYNPYSGRVKVLDGYV